MEEVDRGSRTVCRGRERAYFARARSEMVYGQIHCCGVTDERVLDRFLATPREDYLPDGSSMRSYAYADMDLLLPDGQVLISPRLLARLVQLADIRSDQDVLSIGPAYSHAILEGLGRSVNSQRAHYDVVVISSGAIVDQGISQGALHPPSALSGVLPKVNPSGGRLVFVAGPNKRRGHAYVLHKHGETSSLVQHFDAWAPPAAAG